MFAKILFKRPFTVFILLFLIYLLNIIVGKVSLMTTDRSLPLSLNGVVEFLLIFFACIFFVAGILQAEKTRDNNNLTNNKHQE
jgi:ABC-type bacteriocin/lantibiotic exporter with double-glycine peptidase domain